MSKMFKLRYEGEGRKEVFGIGVFNPSDEKDVPQYVAANFDNQDDRNNGWVVIKPTAAPKSKTTKPALNTKTKTVE